jgi:FkbM family methyltransferase
MTVSKARIEEIARERFFGSRFFGPARTAYQFLFNRQKYANRRQMLRFYSQFVRRGDLVFDVGANIGVYSEIFFELGARVIAIEPNPKCVRLLQALKQRSSVIVEACAASDQPGTLVLQLSAYNQLSSANPNWREKLDQTLQDKAHWQDELTVDATTLTQLAEQHGVPDFVKIDVEGLDDRVIRGMSFKPSVLTFEFNRLLPEVAIRGMESSVFADGYEFNFVHCGTMECVASLWLDRAEFVHQLNELAGDQSNGDIIARLVQPIGR